LNYRLNLSTSTIDYIGYIQYYYTTKLDSLIGTNMDANGNEFVKQKYFFTSDANGKTTSLTSYDWNESNNTFTQAIHITFETANGLNEISENKMEIFPNPSSDNLNLEGISSDADISVFDISGKLMPFEKISQNLINISQLKAGIYNIRIINNNQIITKKFIKQ